MFKETLEEPSEGGSLRADFSMGWERLNQMTDKSVANSGNSMTPCSKQKENSRALFC